ncbi:cytochrome b pre-mRNA-processing protein 3 [Sphingomonas guangdongensis]|uniref:Cytochrome b pre-mRNA-processing protein 3 n=1 Tax=Sphingomonas guangdongensis TaxID=1141890 RepID=A0A285QBP2_9SPHN|nr:cytochrome b pre-mRNA-processing protein 3 [Sphingomonas guangdongensis]
MGLIDRLFGRTNDEAAALYAAVVARARAAHWYVDGGVADTIDGRFDMVAAVLSMVLLRLEAEPGATRTGVALAERFVDDMDPQLRQIGIGDLMVGKHIGRMMSMLGGRLGAYREGLASGDLTPALVRNLYREQPPAPQAVAHVRARLEQFSAALVRTEHDALIGGRLP